MPLRDTISLNSTVRACGDRDLILFSASSPRIEGLKRRQLRNALRLICSFSLVIRGQTVSRNSERPDVSMKRKARSTVPGACQRATSL
ncbi:hypothetical protein D3C71_1780660 [compost metagenome]